jgi:hypothetical protein
VLALGACRVDPGKEITSTKPYADHIGAKYSVVADNLYAYAVYQSLNDRRVSYVELVPRNIGGSEYAFRRQVPKGQVIRILSAWRRFPLLDSSVYYLVEVENSDLPQGIPVELQLDRGNEGADGDLNPAVYRKVP